jgi:hypothetical protein
MTIDTEKLAKLLALIEKTAAYKSAIDAEDFNACDYSGGNFDDAHSQGMRDGEILFARDLMTILE